MDTKKRILAIVDDLICRSKEESNSPCSSSFEETMEYLNDTAYYLKQSDTLYEKELGELIQDKILDIVKEESLCPDCFHKTEYKIIYEASYDSPCEGIVKCTNCEWYQ